MWFADPRALSGTGSPLRDPRSVFPTRSSVLDLEPQRPSRPGCAARPRPHSGARDRGAPRTYYNAHTATHESCWICAVFARGAPCASNLSFTLGHVGGWVGEGVDGRNYHAQSPVRTLADTCALGRFWVCTHAADRAGHAPSPPAAHAGARQHSHPIICARRCPRRRRCVSPERNRNLKVETVA